MAFTSEIIVGINNVLDAILPSFAVNIVAGYYYSARLEHCTKRQDRQYLFYRHMRILSIIANRQNIRKNISTTIADMESWKGCFGMEECQNAFCTIWICNRDILMPREHKMIVESYKAAGIAPTIAIMHSGMFHNGVYPRLGTKAWVMNIAQQFYHSNIDVVYGFINRRRLMGRSTNVSFTHTKKKSVEHYIDYNTTFNIIDMYDMGDTMFIKKFLMRNVYQTCQSMTITAVSGTNTLTDRVKLI
jgi:hypothetical protein